MHPEAVLLPLTYGIASALAIGCHLLCAIAVVCAAFGVAASRVTAGRFKFRPAKSWVPVVLWSALTGWTSAGYRDQYAATVGSLAAHHPAIPDTKANAALLLAVHPTLWAVKTILLGLVGGFIWVGTSRTRAAAALLLAHSQGIAQPPSPVQRAAISKQIAAARLTVPDAAA